MVDSEGSISQAEDYELHDCNLYVVDVVGGIVNETSISFTNGTADINYIAQEMGNGSLTVNLLGLDYTFNFVINISSLYVYAEDIYLGQNATIFAVLPSDATGDVIISLNNESNYTVTLDSGKGNISISDLVAGNYTIFGYYGGNDLNPESNYTNTFNVLPKVDVTIDVNDTEVYQSKGLSVDIIFLDSEINDNVSVTFNNKTYEVEIVDGEGTFECTELIPGEFELIVDYVGNYKYNSANATANIVVLESENVTLTADNLTKYYNNSARFVANLVDSKGNPIVNQSIQFTINRVSYNRTTNENGSASLAINLGSGEYEITVYFDGGNGIYTTETKNYLITILATVNGTDITKVYKNGTQYYATFRDADGNYLADGTAVTFNINGVYYTRYVNGNGLAKLNINLHQGEYIITAINPLTNEYGSNIITVISKIVENNNLVKYYKNDSQYIVRLVNDDGSYVGAGEVVTFNINGVFYNRTTNSSGYAKLNINLNPGDYIITAEYSSCKVSNIITVLPILSADDLEMSYKDGSTFDATLLDGQGNVYSNQKVSFNVNGVFYYRTTNLLGVASLNINLMSGEYIITSSYNGYNIANTILIK